MTKPSKIDKSTAIEFIDTPSDASPEAIDATLEAIAAADIGDNSNAVTFETYLAKATTYGELRGAADDTIAMLAIDICDGARAGCIDPRPTTEKVKANAADTRDDIETLFTKYTDARGLKSIHDRKGNSVKNKTSQLRNFAKLGKLKDVNGPAVLADVVARYKSTYDAADKNMRDGMNNAFDAYTIAAREQLKFPKVALSDDQIGECLNKPAKPNNRTLATEWTKIGNAAQALIDGTKEMPDGSKLEDKSVEGGNLAAMIVAYAKAMVDEIALADAEKKAAELRASMLARNGIAA